MLFNNAPLTAQRFEHNVQSSDFRGAVSSLNLFKLSSLYREYLIFFLWILNHRVHAQQAHYVESMSIQRPYYVDTSKSKFRRISTSFPRIFRCNFANWKSASFPCTFFVVISLVEKSTLFPRTFINAISLVEKSTLLPRTCFEVTSMDEKSTFFPSTFFDVISLVEISTLFLQWSVSPCFYLSFSTVLWANENRRGGFPVFVTLNSWLLQDCSL